MCSFILFLHQNPSFPPPDEAKAEAIKYITNPICQYESVLGNHTLREMIANKYNVNLELVSITSGGLMGIHSVIKTLFQRGIKNIYYPNPGFPPYQYIDTLLTVKTIPYNFIDNELFKNELNTIVSAINEKSVFIITSPNNPNGLVLEDNDWKEIFSLLENHYIIIDNSFIDFEFHSKKSAIQFGNNIFRIFSFSKSYSLADYRVGYVISPNEELSSKVSLNHWNEQLSVSTISQRAAVGALKAKNEYLIKNKEYIKNNLYYAVDLLNQNNIKVSMPEGGFFLWINISDLKMNAKDFVNGCLLDKKLSLIAGDSFGSNGKDHIRINCATDLMSLKEGLIRFISFYKERISENGVRI
ncbi:hypothetical protein COF63_27615 [Bacillus pseudomycoides]|nr:hypothetical protein CON86_24910 [Bacillus pseudomycoides]PEM71496.1 hypothetical protein CN632_23880 [Bacillus pseudomycoides]PHC79148.1 hypothetical protein COF63_27615 [Bacillus pseudomycoides]